uniref:Uncharacterized protein n=1 Tax=Caenorhabditis japonica TaxID=281687 RepID=A0A8R1E9C7_CAEJA
MHCIQNALAFLFVAFYAQGCDEDIQSKLLALNGLIEHDQLATNHHRAPFNHSGLSEDSDYTSDVSVPVNHQLHPNSSAHQYESHLHPHRSRQQQLLHTRDAAASYEDEEDAYHARNQDDVYHHQDTYDQHPSVYFDDYHHQPPPTTSNQPEPLYQEKPYEDTVTPVREYGEPSGSASRPSRQQYDSQVYGYASGSDERYDTPSGRAAPPIMEHNEPEYVYDHNGFPVEEGEEEEEDDEHFGLNPTYSEDRFDGHHSTDDYSTQVQQDYRNDYSQSYQGDYWSESDPLSYNSRPPNGYARTGTTTWREPTSSSRPTSSQAWNYTDDTHQYDEVDRGSRHSFTRTPSVDRTDRMNDSGAGYYDEFGEGGRRPDSHHNWRYDSIQEEDVEKDNWKAHVEGYEEDHEQEEEEKRNFQELWHSAYKRVCADLGIKVSSFLVHLHISLNDDTSSHDKYINKSSDPTYPKFPMKALTGPGKESHIPLFCLGTDKKTFFFFFLVMPLGMIGNSLVM